MRRLCAGAVALLTLSATHIYGASHTLGNVAASPRQLTTSTLTPVVVSVVVPSDADLIPGSLQLLRYDEQGRLVAQLGQLFDDGTHGDITAADGVFSTTVSLSEVGPKSLILKVSAAYRGVLQRTMSAPLYVPVVINESASQAATALSVDLHNGDRTNAYKRLGATFNSLRVLDTLDPGALSQVADVLDHCTVTSTGAAFQLCSGSGLFKGQTQTFEFFLFRDVFGFWRVVSW